jgi:hypothetical protein
MKRNPWKHPLLPALLLAAAAFFSPVPLRAQEPAAEAAAPREAADLKADIARLKREIQRAEAEIRRTDSLARDEQATAARNRERLARDRERREKENAALEARVRETRQRTAAERARGDGYASEAGEIKAREKSVLAFLAMAADSLLARVDGGIPWDGQARRERILSLRRDIDADAATPDEAFARLAALLREEIKGGDEVTLSSRPLTRQNGEVVNAQILKIGNQAIVYADDEGKKFGVLEPGTSDSGSVWTWREDLDFSGRAAVKRAVAIKAGREAPQLAPLAMPLAGVRDNRNADQNGDQNAEGGR